MYLHHDGVHCGWCSGHGTTTSIASTARAPEKRARQADARISSFRTRLPRQSTLLSPKNLPLALATVLFLSSVVNSLQTTARFTSTSLASQASNHRHLEKARPRRREGSREQGEREGAHQGRAREGTTEEEEGRGKARLSRERGKVLLGTEGRHYPPGRKGTHD